MLFIDKTAPFGMIYVHRQQISRRHHDPGFVSSDRTFDEFLLFFSPIVGIRQIGSTLTEGRAEKTRGVAALPKSNGVSSIGNGQRSRVGLIVRCRSSV
jgi:hypothetical protein